MIALPAARQRSAPIVNISRKRLFLALLIASTGFDLVSIHISDDTLRVSYLLYLFLFFALLRHMRLPKSHTALVGIFCVLAIIGSVPIGMPIHSLLYVGWVVFSFGVIFPVFYYFGREHRDDFAAAILIAGRAQILCGFVLFASRLQDRAQLLYYEPSYFAFGLIPYVAFVLWGVLRGRIKTVAWDLALLLVALVETGSATLLLSIVLEWIVGLVFSGLTARRVAGVLAVAAALVVALLAYAQLSDDLLATTINQILNSGNVIEALIERGGNRIPRLMGAAYIFQSNPWVGVGIGQYKAYSGTVNLSQFTKGMSWLSAQNDEAVNIYIELLVTTGIPAACVFIAFLLRVVFARRLRHLDDIQKPLLLGLTSLLIMLNFDGNYLRPYLWMLLGAYSGIICSPTPKLSTGWRPPIAAALSRLRNVARSEPLPG